MDGAGLKFATECLERARPVVTVVIKLFRSETESKYVLCSPTESDHEVPTSSSRAHAPGYNIRTTVVPPQEDHTQAKRPDSLEFSPLVRASSENVRSGVVSSGLLSPTELPSPELLSLENPPSEELPTDLLRSLDSALEPAQRGSEVKGSMESLSADDSFREEKITALHVEDRDGDATEGPENEEYPSDDDDLLLKVGVVE